MKNLLYYKGKNFGYHIADSYIGSILTFRYFFGEDTIYRRYINDKPRYSPNEMLNYKIQNKNRRKCLRLTFTIFKLIIDINIPLNKVGNLYFGNPIKEKESVQYFRLLREFELKYIGERI